MGISSVKTSRDLSSAIHYFSLQWHNGHKEALCIKSFVNCTEQRHNGQAIREYFGKERTFTD